MSSRQAGRNSRLPGTEWRWKDDHDQDDRRALQPTAGRVVVNGHDMAEEPELAKSSLGFIPDRSAACRKLTAAEFLRFHGAGAALLTMTLARAFGRCSTFSNCGDGKTGSSRAFLTE